MPTPRGALATGVVDGKIYAIGGLTSVSNLVGLSVVEAYDPETDTWMRRADLPTPRFALCTSVVDGRIYAIGGGRQSPGVSTVEAYDPTTDTWTTMTPMPTPRRHFATCVVGGRIYAIGGWERSSLYPYPTVEQYDPRTNTWIEEMAMPASLSCCSASVVNQKVYVMGGTYRPHPCPALATVYELTLGGRPLDFTGDGKVDVEDLLAMIASWGRDDARYDIAPVPFGDGAVDAEDLELLMAYWEQEVDDATLIAHWKLDEAEGATASNSAGSHVATVFGDPLWQPVDGQVGGAIQLDGATFLTADFVLNPANGPFSVLAWVKGGAPGQVIVSQEGGANWLMLDPIAGSVMTELWSGGRSSTKLSSDICISDGDWHRVGFSWDGISHRSLFIDGVLAAEDTQAGLAQCSGGVNLGGGKDMALDTYWTGLIDDVRIYNRAVIP
jgi:hypothetical protein